MNKAIAELLTQQILSLENKTTNYGEMNILEFFEQQNHGHLSSETIHKHQNKHSHLSTYFRDSQNINAAIATEDF